MRTHLLGCWIVLCGASLAQAQQWPAYPGGAYYPQRYPMQQVYPGQYAPAANAYPQQPVYPSQYPNGMNAYPQSFAPPAKGPHVYYGDFPNAGSATATTPTPAPITTYLETSPSAMPGHGSIQYDYPDNMGTSPPYNFYPYTMANRPYAARNAPAKMTGWPAPANRVSLPPGDDVDPADGPLATPKTIVNLPFHRPTKDRGWVSADYLAAFNRPMGLATPLLTSGSPNDPSAGALGQSSTSVLFGNHTVDFGLFSGVRAEAGIFLDDCDRFSLDVRGFWLFQNSQSYFNAGDGTGNPQFSRPVFNVAAGREGAFVNTVPGIITGTFLFESKSQMGGIELNARYHWYGYQRFHADALFGFRYANLQESLSIKEMINPLVPNFLTFQGNLVNPPDSLTNTDTFATNNHFFGPQIGGRLNWEYYWLTLTGFAKVGVGATQQITDIGGTTTLLSANGNQTVQGGILALPSNAGQHRRTVLGILPEFGFNVGVDLTQNVRLNLGYSLLMWNHVVRPGSQFDRGVNPNQVPGSPTFGPVSGTVAPIYRFNDELFWSQALNFGVEYRY